jgi:hypothetical protein
MRAMTLETFIRHPAIGTRLVDSRPVGPVELGFIEVSMSGFAAAGLDNDALVAHYAARRSLRRPLVPYAGTSEEITAVSRTSGFSGPKCLRM